MDKVLEALERLKTAPTFMGGTAEYQACTKSETLLMQDYETVKQFILKAQEQELHNGGRLPNKEILSLKHCVEQCKDKPILYISETYGNKYIVPQKELDDLTKEKELLKEIIKSLFDRGCPLHQYVDKEFGLTIEVDDECSIMRLGEYKGIDLDKYLKEVLEKE